MERVRARAALPLFALTLASGAARAAALAAEQPGNPDVFYRSSGRLGALAAVLIGVIGSSAACERSLPPARLVLVMNDAAQAWRSWQDRWP